MRRADRLFDIIQMLRSASLPLAAAAMAEQLEVAVRTVYRDIAALQASRVPIEGERGLGYVLRRGFDLPPLMFTAEEIHAIAVAGRLVGRFRDPGLQTAMAKVLSKLATVLPESLQTGMTEPAIFVSGETKPQSSGVDLPATLGAIRDNRKMHITYCDAVGMTTQRTVWPISFAYYVDVALLASWCELRADYRHFRIDRILSSAVLSDGFPSEGGDLTARWRALQRPVLSDASIDHQRTSADANRV